MKTNFNEYGTILEAERVTIHDLIEYFDKDLLDYDAHGNVFVAFNKENKGSPILVAHMDNVLKGTREPVLSVDGRYMMGRKAGIGFDDKAGIIANIELFKRMEGKVRIIFTTDEEIGGVSAGKLDPSRIKDAKYMIELDRRDRKDLIQYSGSTRLCSDSFAEKIEAVGFKRATGTFTDVNKFKAKCPQVEMCNLSIGYFNAHTDNEYLDLEYFDEILDKVEIILNTFTDTYVDNQKDTQVDKVKDYYRGTYNNYSGYYNSYYDDDDDDGIEYCENCGCVLPRDKSKIFKTVDGYKCCSEICRDELEEFLLESATEDNDDNVKDDNR